jgi:hypothetical protein
MSTGLGSLRFAAGIERLQSEAFLQTALCFLCFIDMTYAASLI